MKEYNLILKELVSNVISYNNSNLDIVNMKNYGKEIWNIKLLRKFYFREFNIKQ